MPSWEKHSNLVWYSCCFLLILHSRTLLSDVISSSSGSNLCLHFCLIKRKCIELRALLCNKNLESLRCENISRTDVEISRIFCASMLQVRGRWWVIRYRSKSFAYILKALYVFSLIANTVTIAINILSFILSISSFFAVFLFSPLILSITFEFFSSCTRLSILFPIIICNFCLSVIHSFSRNYFPRFIITHWPLIGLIDTTMSVFVCCGRICNFVLISVGWLLCAEYPTRIKRVRATCFRQRMN
jgi:hypothetical protein